MATFAGQSSSMDEDHDRKSCRASQLWAPHIQKQAVLRTFHVVVVTTALVALAAKLEGIIGFLAVCEGLLFQLLRWSPS